MPSNLSDQEIQQRGLSALEHELGPVDALRFLALMARERFDYQEWRDKHFSGMTLEEVLEGCRSISTQSVST